MKRQTPSFFFQRKWFAKLNQELLLFCHPLPLPPLACSLPPSFSVALSALENCGSSNLHHLLCNPIFKPLTMGFHTRTSQMGDQRQEDSEFHPLKSHLENKSYGQVSSPGVATQRLAASLPITVVLEKANGNRQITPPRGFIWLSKASELIRRF